MNKLDFANKLDTSYRVDCARLETDTPWRAGLTLQTDRKSIEYRIGESDHLDSKIISWKHHMAAAYYDTPVGDTFEPDDDGYAHIEGTVTRKLTVTNYGRSLRWVKLEETTGKTLLLSNDKGEWYEGDEGLPKDPKTGLPDIRFLLTSQQYRLITGSRRKPVILQGRAGSGKTTVALYRLSWLSYANDYSSEPPIDPGKVLIVMFNKALSNFVRTSLTPLNLQDARLDTFHSWARAELEAAYGGKLEMDTTLREGEKTAAAIKKQLGILKVIDEYVAGQTLRLEQWLTERLTPYRAQSLVEDMRKNPLPVVKKLAALRTKAITLKTAATGKDRERLEQVHVILNQAVKRTTRYKEELLQILKDKTLLQRHLPDVSEAALNELAQFQTQVQKEGGTDRWLGPKVRFEDLALLLRLIQLKCGGLPVSGKEEAAKLYDHLVVDEAQDFGAVELRARPPIMEANQRRMEISGAVRLLKPYAQRGGTSSIRVRVASSDVGRTSNSPMGCGKGDVVGDGWRHDCNASYGDS